MDVEISEEKGSAFLHVRGSLDMKNVELFERKILEEISDFDKEITLDCEELSYVSSVGVSVLLYLTKRMKKFDRKLKLMNVNPVVGEMLRLSDLVGKAVVIR